MQSQGVNVPAAQQLRFKKQAKVPKPVVKAVPSMLKDQNFKAARGPWTPSFSVAFRMIIIIRFFAAMYSTISDCDEGTSTAARSRDCS
jgi:alpha-1,2-mannosyltransferase